MAIALNRHHGRKGKFFEGRYYKAHVLDTKALLDRFNDITLGPVKAGLVEKVEDWPGVNSWDYFTREENVHGSRLNRTEYRRQKRKSENKRKKYEMPKDAGVEHFEFALSRLPGFENLPDAEYREMLKKRVNERFAEFKKENADQKRKYMGVKHIMKLTWRDGPDDYEVFGKYGKEIRPISMGKDELRQAHLAHYREIARVYAEAMRAYIYDWDASKFPPYTCPPGLIKCRLPPKAKMIEGPTSPVVLGDDDAQSG